MQGNLEGEMKALGSVGFKLSTQKIVSRHSTFQLRGVLREPALISNTESLERWEDE
jgi:hypothetical protein